MKHICQECHNKRQERKELESQPLQWTGDTSEYIKGCDDCKQRSPGTKYYYANAYELLLDLTEAKEKLKNLEATPDFPCPLYASASDMLDQARLFPAILQDVEAFIQVLKYAEELEEVFEK